MKSIKSQLIIVFSLVIILSTGALSIMGLLEFNQALTITAEESLVTSSVDAANLTNSRIETQLKTLEMIALNSEIQSMDWNKQQAILKEQLGNTNFLEIAIVSPDGTANYSDGTTSQLGDRAYVENAMNGKMNVSDVIVSKVTNEKVIMYAVPIERDNKVVGAVVGRRDGDSLSQITDTAGYGESGYGYIINGKGTIMAHPDRDKVINLYNPIEELENDPSLDSTVKLFEEMLKLKSGVSEYTFQGSNLYVGYAPIEGTEWIFVITAEKSDVLSAIPKMIRSIAIIMVLVLIISIVITYLVGGFIAKPIIEAVKQSERIADLDITQNIAESSLNKTNEIGTLSKALQKITDSLRGIIGEISRSAESVAASSEELTATSIQSATASEEVSLTITEIARGASDQAQNTEAGSTMANALGGTIENNQLYLNELNTTNTKVTQVLEEGLKEIQFLSEVTEESNKASNAIYQIILKTNESANRIQEASSVIASIAAQTNLLSLNAAIESARAGEAGKGFAVVAEEIRHLSEQSAEATKDIDNMVHDLQVNSNSAVKTMENVAETVKSQTNSVDTTRKSYLEMSEVIEISNEAVRQINVSGNEMEEMKNEIQGTLENLSAIAEENSAATQEVTAAIEEQTAASEEIANSSEGLASLAADLQDIIRKFKI